MNFVVNYIFETSLDVRVFVFPGATCRIFITTCIFDFYLVK